MLTLQPAVNLGFLYINGFNFTWTSNTTISISSGQCRDYTNSVDINIGNFLGFYSQLPQNVITTLNLSTNGVNGLDAGTIQTNTAYYVYAIIDIVTGENGFIASASNTAPTMPSNVFGSAYTHYKLIGHLATHSSPQILPFLESGSADNKIIQYYTPQPVVINGSATTFTSVNLSQFVPNFNFVTVNFIARFRASSINLKAYFRTTNTAVTSANSPIIMISQVVNNPITTDFPLITSQTTFSGNLRPSVDYVLDSGGVLEELGILGYEFNV